MDFIISVLIFFFGAIIGSFLNVVILRYRSGRTIGGRSMCFSCGKTLTWSELVPLGSFLTQGGKCAGCRTRISWQYPAVEAITGFIFVALYFRFGYLLLGTPVLFAILFSYYAIVCSILMVLSVYDIKHKILPDRLTFLFASITFIGMFFIVNDSLVVYLPTVSHLIAGLVIPLPFAFLWMISKGKWMGLGDAKLMIGIGFLLGLSRGVAAVMIAFWIGAFVSIVMLFFTARMEKKNISLKTAIPFGPFLALATIIVLVTHIDMGTIASILTW